MDELLDSVRSYAEGQIDFEGQRLAEQLNFVLLTLTGALAFIAGFVTQNIVYTLWSALAGTVLTLLVVVPPWPFFNQHPVKWLAMPGSNVHVEVDGQRIKGS